MPTARIDSAGKAYQLDRPAQPDEVVTEQDVQQPAKLARMLGKLLKDVAGLLRRANPARIDFENVVCGTNGTSVRLAHRFNGRARWSVIGWDTPSASGGQPWRSSLWIQRAFFGPLTLASGAANSTVGARFAVSSKTRIAGARVAWKGTGGTKTLKVSLWRDSDGARLASGTASVLLSGCYEVLFDTPVIIDGGDLSANLSIGVYDQAGVNYTYTGVDAPFTGLLSMQLPGVILQAINLTSAGDARPTTPAGAELYWIEPLLSGAPALIEDIANSDANTLALKSYGPGVATIRVEEAG